MTEPTLRGALLLGDNPFIGVEHLDRERARRKGADRRVETQMEVIGAALDNGASGYVFSLHPANQELFEEMAGRAFGRRLDLYPLLPYAQTYVQLATERGLVGMLRHVMGKMGWGDRLSSIAAGAGALVNGIDVPRMFRLYLRMEIESLRKTLPENLCVRAVFLHEVLTDLCVAFQAPQMLAEHKRILQGDLGLRAGFVTRNLPAFLEVARQAPGLLDGAAVMTPVNALGFQMSPSREACEQALREAEGAGVEVVAMSPLAAGRLAPEQAVRYLAGIPFGGGVVLGTSKPKNAAQSFTVLSALRHADLPAAIPPLPVTVPRTAPAGAV